MRCGSTANWRKEKRTAFVLWALHWPQPITPIRWTKPNALPYLPASKDTIASLPIIPKQWDELWQSDIQIEGDAQAQQDIHSMIYHLYSFVREGSALSISPMGLSGLGYNGHIFWECRYMDISRLADATTSIGAVAYSLSNWQTGGSP